MPICQNCGSEVAEGRDRCNHCGQRLGDKSLDVYDEKDPSVDLLDERRIGQYFRTGWQTFNLYPLGFMGFWLLTLLVKLIIMLLWQHSYIIALLMGIYLYPLYMGDYLVSAKLLQRQPCHFLDFFCGYHYYQPLMIFGVIIISISAFPNFLEFSRLLGVLGKLAFLIFSVFYFFTPLLIIDRRLDFWGAMEFSRRTVQRQVFAFLIFDFLGFLLIVPSGIAFFIGIPAAQSGVAKLAIVAGAGIALLVAAPVFSCAVTAAYADLFGFQSKEY